MHKCRRLTNIYNHLRLYRPLVELYSKRHRSNGCQHQIFVVILWSMVVLLSVVELLWSVVVWSLSLLAVVFVWLVLVYIGHDLYPANEHISRRSLVDIFRRFPDCIDHHFHSSIVGHGLNKGRLSQKTITTKQNTKINPLSLLNVTIIIPQLLISLFFLEDLYSFVTIHLHWRHENLS